MQSPQGNRRHHWTVLAAAATIAAAALYFAVPWDGGDQPVEAPPADPGLVAAPFEFSAEPLWTTPGEAWEGNPDGIKVGLTNISDARLGGDRLVLVGTDENGRLGGYKGEGTLVVVDASTGETIWGAYNRMPVPGDEEKELEAFGSRWSIEIVGDGDSAAIAVEYRDYDPDTGWELGVVGLALDDGAPLWQVPAGTPSEADRDLNIVGAGGDDLLVNIFSADSDDPGVETALFDTVAAQTLWTSPDHIAAGITGDTAILVDTVTASGDLGFREVVTAVDVATGDPLWQSGDAEVSTEYMGQASGIVMVNHRGATALDLATGEALDRIDSAYFLGCHTDNETLVACGLADDDVQLTEVPDTDRLNAVAVAAGWIFTDEEVVPRGNYLAVDPAGNTTTTPGQLADTDGGLAVFYTGDIYHDSAWGTEAAAVAVHTLGT